ncbi:mucin-2-like isoform X2 [Scylla paramamosain]|uniref:mucin-2-like isoform X2 n=1 Tax=Scylla paramamosain TaxID=85552 RepID=UPI003082A371
MVSRHLAVAVLLLLEVRPVPANLFALSGRAEASLMNITKEAPGWQTKSDHVDDILLGRSRPFVPFNSLTFSNDSSSPSSSFTWVPPNMESIRQKIANSKLAGKKPGNLKPVAATPTPAAMTKSTPPPRPSSLIGLTNYSRPDMPHQSWDNMGIVDQTHLPSPQATHSVFSNSGMRTPASIGSSSSKRPPPTTTATPTLYTWSTVSDNEVTKTPPPVRPPHMSILYTMKPSSFAVSLPSVVIGVGRPSSPRPFFSVRPSSSPARPSYVSSSPSITLPLSITLSPPTRAPPPPTRASPPPPTRASPPPPTRASPPPPTRAPPPLPTRAPPPLTRAPPPSTTRAPPPLPTRPPSPPPTTRTPPPPTTIPPPPPTRFFPPPPPPPPPTKVPPAPPTRAPPPSLTKPPPPPPRPRPPPTRRSSPSARPPPPSTRLPPPPRPRPSPIRPSPPPTRLPPPTPPPRQRPPPTTPPLPPTRLPPPPPPARPLPPTTTPPAVASTLPPIRPASQATQSPALVPAVTWFPLPQVFTLPSTTPPVSYAQGIVTWFPPYTKLSQANSSHTAATSEPGSFSVASSFPSTPPAPVSLKLSQPPGSKYQVRPHARPGSLRPSIITWRPSYEPIIVKQPSTTAHSGDLLVTFTPRPHGAVQEDTTLSPATSSSKLPPLKSSAASLVNNYPFRIKTQWNAFSHGSTPRPPIRLTETPEAATPTPASLAVLHASAQTEMQNTKKEGPQTQITQPSSHPLPGAVTIPPGDSQVLQQVLKDMTGEEETVMVKKTSSSPQMTQRPSVSSRPPAGFLAGGFVVKRNVSGVTNQGVEVRPEKQGAVNSFSGISSLSRPTSTPVATTTTTTTTNATAQTSPAVNPDLTFQSSTSATTATNSLPSTPYWYASPSGATHPLAPSTKLPPLHHTHTPVFASPGAPHPGIPAGGYQSMPHHHLHAPPTAQEGPGVTAAGMSGTHPEQEPHVLVKVWSAEGGRFTLVSSSRVPSHALASNNIPDLQPTSPPPPLLFPHYTFQYPKTHSTSPHSISPESGSPGPLPHPAFTFPLVPSIFPPRPSPLPTRLSYTTHTQQGTKDALTHTPLVYDSLNTKELLEVLKLKLLTQDSSQTHPQDHDHPWHLDSGVTQSPVMPSTIRQEAEIMEQPAQDPPPHGSVSDPPHLGDPLNQADFLHNPVFIVGVNDSFSESHLSIPPLSSSTNDTLDYSYHETYHYFTTIPDHPPRSPSSPSHHSGIQQYAPLYSGLLPQTLQHLPLAVTNTTSLDSFQLVSQYSSLLQDSNFYEPQNFTLATGPPTSSPPSSPHHTPQPVSVPPPTTGESSSSPGLTLPISNLLENSILLSNILEELLQDLSHSNSTLGHQETLPLEDESVSLTNDVQHLKDHSPPPSATPVSHQTLINPLLPPLLPILLGHSFSPESFTSAPQNTSSGTHYKVPPTTSDIFLPPKHNIVAAMKERPLSSATATDDAYSLPHFSPGSAIATNISTAPGDTSTTTAPINALTSGLPNDSVTTESTSPPQVSTSHPVISAQFLKDSNNLKESSLFFPDWTDKLNIKQTSYHESHTPSHRQPSKYVTPSSVSLHASIASSPELFEVLTNLQHSLRSPTMPVRPHLSNLTEKNEFDDFPAYLANNFMNHTSFPSIGQHLTPPDADGMESEHQAGLSSWTSLGSSSGEPAWQDLLQPSYLEAFFADLDMEDPHIRRILRTLALIYIFAINPHLHILNLQDNHHESLSSAQVSTSQLSLNTEPVILNSFSPGQGGDEPVLLNEVLMPHSILQKDDFPSSHQVEVTSSSASLKDDNFLSRIEPIAPVGTPASSGSSGATTEKSHMDECLKKSWCALGMALTMAAGTTSAVAVPLMVPLLGRRRRKLTFAPLSSSSPHLPPRLSLAAKIDSRLRRSPKTMLAAILRRMAFHNHQNSVSSVASIGGGGNSRQESDSGVVHHRLKAPSVTTSVSSTDKVFSHSKSFISASQPSGLEEVDNARSF